MPPCETAAASAPEARTVFGARVLRPSAFQPVLGASPPLSACGVEDGRSPGLSA